MKDIKTFPQFLCALAKPVFPIFRNLFVEAKLVNPPTSGRHRYPLGLLKKSFSVKEFQILMRERGFFKQPMAFNDPDQILSLRKLDPTDFNFQYHIRLYKDGEIRGHHEKTPEDHPLDHLREIGFTSHREEFLEMLAGVLDRVEVISLLDLSTQEKPNHTSRLPYLELVREAERDGDQ